MIDINHFRISYLVHKTTLSTIEDCSPSSIKIVQFFTSVTISLMRPRVCVCMCFTHTFFFVRDRSINVFGDVLTSKVYESNRRNRTEEKKVENERHYVHHISDRNQTIDHKNYFTRKILMTRIITEKKFDEKRK